VEAEDRRQLRLHAVETLADRLTAHGDYGDAAAALAAVRAEPLRESPRAALIRVHIAEGNPSEALRGYSRYSELLRLELDVEPTQRLRQLVSDLWPSRPVTVGAPSCGHGRTHRRPHSSRSGRGCEDGSARRLRVEIRLAEDVAAGFGSSATVTIRSR
jgi:SARP family transcriptional regulator, regulator of embCAB operon